MPRADVASMTSNARGTALPRTWSTLPRLPQKPLGPKVLEGSNPSASALFDATYNRGMRSLHLFVVAAACAWPKSFALATQSAPTVRVSVSATGVQASGASQAPRMTPDGTRVAFYSTAPNLIAGDTNTFSDVFVKHLGTQTVTRISVSTGGGQATGPSGWDGTQVVPSDISDDGQVVAFCSTATNLVGGDTNGAADVFVRDLSSATTKRVSVSSSGAQATGASKTLALSADGQWVAFSSLANNLTSGDNAHEDVFLHQRGNATTILVSVDSTGLKGVGNSSLPGLSADGQRIVFQSIAGSFDPFDNNGDLDVFLRDLATSTTTRISAGPGGSSAAGGSFSPAISADGRFIAFASSAPNLVPGDTNATTDVFVFDTLQSTTALISTSSSGQQGDSISGQPRLNFDGSWCVFESQATNLVTADANGQRDVFVRDLAGGVTTRASLTWDSQPSAGASFRPALSADARYVVFDSASSDFVQLDSNGVSDVFRRDRQGSPPMVYCTPKINSQGCVPSIQFLGLPSGSLGSGFNVFATSELNQAFGVLFYSLTGPAANPFQGGFMCCLQPLVRTPVQNSGGNPPPSDCSGTFQFDFNTYVASGTDPALGIGVTVWSQYWSRDEQSPSTTNLTDALRFTIGD